MPAPYDGYSARTRHYEAEATEMRTTYVLLVENGGPFRVQTNGEQYRQHFPPGCAQ